MLSKSDALRRLWRQLKFERTNPMRQLSTVFGLLFLTILVHSTAVGQESDHKTLDATRVPKEAARVEDFVPKGWTIHHRAVGDLNGDYLDDVALILFDLTRATEPSMLVDHPQPALVIAFATEQGRWRLAGINTRLIVADDSGFRPLRLEITKGVVVVHQELQSNISENTLDYAYTYRFRYDAQTHRFLLIGEDNANTHRDAVDDGIRVSDNYVTGQRVITLMHAAHGKYVRETNRSRSIERRTIFLENADEGEDIDFDTLRDEFSRPESHKRPAKP